MLGLGTKPGDGLLDLGTERVGLENAGADVGGDGDTGFAGSEAEELDFFQAEADGDGAAFAVGILIELGDGDELAREGVAGSLRAGS